MSEEGIGRLAYLRLVLEGYAELGIEAPEELVKEFRELLYLASEVERREKLAQRRARQENWKRRFE